jgi:hypothetical protein
MDSTEAQEPTPAEKRAAQEAKNRIDRPECKFPQYTALTAYQRGCRCQPCVDSRRQVSRRCQKEAYLRDPEKFRVRQRAYLARKKAKNGV